MRVLVACEESQVVCAAFRSLGHEAYSCDIQEPSGGHPEWHVRGDALELLKGGVITTMDGVCHEIPKWNMLIAFPPCTYLTCASAVRLFNADHSIKDPARYQKGLDAAAFFCAFLNADIPMIAIENPVPLKIFNLPPCTQKIEPYYFGDPWRKRTCLWLVNLPELRPTNIVEPQGLWVGTSSARRGFRSDEHCVLNTIRDSKRRAKTFRGIANAIAQQYSEYAAANGIT